MTYASSVSVPTGNVTILCLPFNPKYTCCVWKVTMAVDNLVIVVWVCPI